MISPDVKNTDKQNTAPCTSIKSENAKKRRTGPKPPKRITESYLHNSGLYYLQRFAASTSHFRRVMLRKISRSCKHHADQNHDDCLKLLDALIVKFQRAGLLDDAAYTRGMITSLRRRGLSKRVIMQKLNEKGIPREEAQIALEDFDTENHDDTQHAELAAALRAARKKRIGPFLPPDKENNPDKAIAALARAGFSYDIAQKILSMTVEEGNNSSEY